MQNMNLEMIRSSIFVLALFLFYILQHWKPAISLRLKNRTRTNFFIFISSFLSLRLLIPMGITGVIVISQDKGFYLFSLHKLSYWQDIILTILLFDLLIYWQHRLFHLINPLWRIHKVHHSDTEMDVSTGLRFHPFEIIISALYKIFFLILFSPRVDAFIIYEILLNTMAMFNHSNFQIPKHIDKFLRVFIVTPAMHYPHHDTDNKLMNLNFGNTFSLWDRIFGTYTNQDYLTFGVQDLPVADSNDYIKLIKMPLTKQ